MSTAILRSPEPESPYLHLVKQTVEACRVAKEAAAAAAEGVATASSVLLNSLRDQEKELDRLDMAADLQLNSRLGCQAVITRPGCYIVEIPKWNRNYVSEGKPLALAENK